MKQEFTKYRFRSAAMFLSASLFASAMVTGAAWANGSGSASASQLQQTPSSQMITTNRQMQSKVYLRDLPLQDSIVVVKGDGRYKMAVFFDPMCQPCKKMESEIEKINNVTVYYFPTNLLGKRSAEINRAIMCAPDKAGALRAWMINGVIPPAAPANCNSEASNRNTNFLKSHGSTLVPTSYFANGTRVSGLQSSDTIEQLLLTLGK